MNIPIKYVILEGPDCSGKTSLYSALHKETKFKYNIQDRSFLSMLCYARLYGRPEAEHRAALREELCDLNNFLVVLMPPVNVVLERLRSRGDEFQDDASLLKLYRTFQEEVSKIIALPNVLVLSRDASLSDQAREVSRDIQEYSEQSPGVFGHTIRHCTFLSKDQEVQARVEFDVPPQYTDPSILNDPHEGEYFLDILKSCEEVIHDEMSGKNPYGAPQGLDSRRFYYHSDTCISSIHFLPRDGDLKVISLLRSTDSVKNGTLDLRFLAHLSTEIPRTFGWAVNSVRLVVQFDSLHVRRDAV
jgi:thymidylate kinase